MRGLPGALLALAIGCAAPPAESPAGVGVARVVDCNDPRSAVGGARLACAMQRDDATQAARAEARQAAAKPGPGCQAWAGMTEGERVDVLAALRHDWATVYDLSPDTRWCLTSDRSLEQQLEEVDRACAIGGAGSYETALDRALRRCSAFPSD